MTWVARGFRVRVRVRLYYYLILGTEHSLQGRTYRDLAASSASDPNDKGKFMYPQNIYIYIYIYPVIYPKVGLKIVAECSSVVSAP